LSAVGGFARGQRRAWNRALTGTLLMLLVTVPLAPVVDRVRNVAGGIRRREPIVLLAARRRLEAG
jgi:hypothetical protein